MGMDVASPDINSVETTHITSPNSHVVDFAIGAASEYQMENRRIG